MENNKSQVYQITEVFFSIQGEGRWIGYPAIFIRFAFCNLGYSICTWCDTDFSHKLTLTKKQIYDKIKNYPCKIIVLTGGEPSLQLKLDKDGNSDFVQFFKDKNYKVHIESNGTKELPKNLDWVTISPKVKWIVKGGDELKVVYLGQDLEQYNHTSFRYYYLQPCYTKSYVNYKETIKKVMEDNRWLLSIQIQKILKIK